MSNVSVELKNYLDSYLKTGKVINFSAKFKQLLQQAKHELNNQEIQSLLQDLIETSIKYHKSKGSGKGAAQKDMREQRILTALDAMLPLTDKITADYFSSALNSGRARVCLKLLGYLRYQHIPPQDRLATVKDTLNQSKYILEKPEAVRQVLNSIRIGSDNAAVAVARNGATFPQAEHGSGAVDLFLKALLRFQIDMSPWIGRNRERNGGHSGYELYKNGIDFIEEKLDYNDGKLEKYTDNFYDPIIDNAEIKAEMLVVARDKDDNLGDINNPIKAFTTIFSAFGKEYLSNNQKSSNSDSNNKNADFNTLLGNFLNKF